MASSLENEPFKNREHVKAEISRCALFGARIEAESKKGSIELPKQ
jgi:hypothetical protein